MKIAILNDTHMGLRNSNRIFENELLKFFFEVFFPYLEHYKIKDIIIAGDVFDDRRSMNIRTLNTARQFFDYLEQKEIRTFITPGNHDLYFKSKIEPNSVQPLIEHYKNIFYIGEPTDVTYEGVKFLLVPWICDENEDLALDKFKNSDAKILVTHADIQGSQHVPGIISQHGYPTDLFDHFYMVLNGHIHTRSSFNNIVNLGVQYQQNWSDLNQVKGFHVFETETMNLEFIPNPSTLYDKFYYDDDLVEGIDPLQWVEENRERIENKFIKFVISNRKNRFLFEKFVQKLETIDKHELTFIDNDMYSFEEQDIDAEIFSQQKSTLHIIADCINEYDTKLNKEVILKFINQLYVESLNRDILKE